MEGVAADLDQSFTLKRQKQTDERTYSTTAYQKQNVWLERKEKKKMRSPGVDYITIVSMMGGGGDSGV